MSCDFDCLDVSIFNNVNAYYAEPEVGTALREIAIQKLLPLDLVIALKAIGNTDANIIDLYAPLLNYLNKSYLLYWSSVIIWNPIEKNYFFRTIRTDNILAPYFDETHKFADENYYKDHIMSLTNIIFGKSQISKPVILHKAPLIEGDRFLTMDISDISTVISDKLILQHGQDIKTVIVKLSEDKALMKFIETLAIPEELSIILSKKIDFLKYLVWLQMLDNQWKYYYYLPTSFISEETGGQTLAVMKELDRRHITKIMIINGIIHEPISRKYSEQLRIRDVKATINLIEQTYHDITRRYLTIFENNDGTKEVARLLRSKIDYLLHLARGDTDSNEERSIDIANELSDLFNLLHYDLKDEFSLDEHGIESLRGSHISIYPGAFRALFENLIGNTCKHAWNGSDKVEIYIGLENNTRHTMIYKDNGQGFPETLDGIDILKKIENWFEGIFSENDKTQREEKGTIRGMGLYIIKQASEFLKWRIIPEKKETIVNGKVHIEYRIQWS